MGITIPHNFNPEKRPYQLEILKNPARFKSLIIHRKAGKTALSINHLVQQAMLNKNKIFWYVAPTYKQAKEIVWRDPDMLNKYVPKEIIAKKNESELTITFINGSVLGIKGADDPDSLRGPNPYGTVLDEFAVMKPVVWEEIISPIAYANPDAWVWFVGTPKPQGAHFKKLHDTAKERDNWFTYEMSAETSGIIPEEALADAKATMTQAGYEQEYLCKWHDDGGVVFRGVSNIIYGDYKEPKEPGTYQWGVDLAKLVDWTVLTGINKINHHVEIFDRFNQVDWNLQKARLEAKIRKFGKGLVNMDATGVGEPIVEDMARQGLNINGLKFTSQFKDDLITNLAIGIEQQQLKIPYIPEMIEELNSFGYEVLNSGRVRYGAPEGLHDDIVISLALAWWEIGSKLSNMSDPVVRLLNQRKEANTKTVGADIE